MGKLTSTVWNLEITASSEPPPSRADRLHPQLCIADDLAGHLADRRQLMQKSIEVIIDPADDCTEAEAARRLLKAIVRQLRIRMYSRFDDADVYRLPMDVVGWSVLRFWASRDGRHHGCGGQVYVDLLLILDIRTGGEQIVTSELVK